MWNNFFQSQRALWVTVMLAGLSPHFAEHCSVASGQLLARFVLCVDEFIPLCLSLLLVI